MPAAQPMTTTSRAARRRWWRWAAMALGAGLLVYLVRSLPARQLVPLFVALGPALPVLPVLAVLWLAAYARGMGIFLGGEVRWTRLLYNRLVADAWAALTPLGGLGGEPVKILDLAPQVGAARAVRATVLDRLAYAAAGLVFSGVGSLIAVGTYRWSAVTENALLAYGVLALLVATALGLAATRTRWAARLFRNGGGAVPARVFVRALLWNLLGRVLGLLEIALLLLALGQAVRPEAVVAIGALLAVSGIVFFFVPSGVGVSEGAAVLALSLTGYPETVGLAVGLARRVRSLSMAGLGLALHTFWPPSGQKSPQADAVDGTAGGHP